MRKIFAALAFAGCAATTAAAAPITTGKELVDVCKIYAAKDENALRQADPCRNFLVDFFQAYVEAEKLRQDAILKGTPVAAPQSCVRLPDFLSYREMAQRVVAYGGANPADQNGPAAALAQKTLERDFPCPAEKPH